MKILRKIRSLFRRQKLDVEMTEEMRVHLEMQVERNIAAGMNPDEARYLAQRQFGNVASIQEQAREGRGWIWLEQLAQDLRYALRSLRKSPGFTATVVLTLALGIGANSAIFSVVNGVLLKPLAYHEPQRLVTLLHEGKWPVAPADFLDWRAQNQSFQMMAAAELWGATLTGMERAEAVPGIRFSDGMFELLGVAPLFGRTFQPQDFKSDATRVIVLGHGLWQRRFGGDKDILGRVVTLSGETYTVIGVMPARFLFAPFWATGAEMAAPLKFATGTTSRNQNSLRVFARLKPEVSIEKSQVEMNAICRQLAQAYPETNTGRTVQVESLLDKTVGDVRGSLRLLTGAVVCVLLIACANVANLLLARATVRRKEMAVRSALGASRGRTIRQLLTESALLAGGGGVLGLMLGYPAIDAIKLLLAASAPVRVRMPRLDDITMDSTTIFFTLAVVVVTGLGCGLVPTLQSARRAEQDALQQDGRGTTAGPPGRRFRNLLVVAEIALALTLLAGAGLLLRSFENVKAIDPGFAQNGVLSMMVSLQGQPAMVGENREAFYRESLEKISALPGVISASATNHLPLTGDQWACPFTVEGRPLPKVGERSAVIYRVARAGYLDTMKISLSLGRGFSARDVAKAPGVVIINEQLARKFWPDKNPVGQRVSLDDSNENEARKWLTIVGVIKDVRQAGWIHEASDEVYVPFAQTAYATNASGQYSAMTLVVRTAVDPVTLASAIRKTIAGINRDAPVSNVASLEQIVSATLWQPRFNLLLTAIFGGVALILATIGLYGVLSYAVAQRTREIGVRIALGASSLDVLGLTFTEGLKLTCLGLALGLAGAFSLMHLLTALIYGVKPVDPVTFAGASLILLISTVLACWLPARRAAEVDPVIALRAE
ncbi:MAG TPA: ABC transporter permease [Lacunisphaera sp.]|jgi:putative ABC transport system permease protein